MNIINSLGQNFALVKMYREGRSPRRQTVFGAKFVLAAINVGQNGLGQIPLLMDIAGYPTTVD